jgi:hypothetical protein
VRLPTQSPKKLFLKSETYRFSSSSTSKLSILNKYQSSILTKNPQLIPQNTFTSQLRFSLLRSFSTNCSNLSYYRPPKNYTYNGSLISKVWARIPDSIKLFGLIGISAYLVVFVALPIVIIVVPPLVIGTWLFVKLNRYFKKKTLQRTLENITNSTLIYYPKVSNTKLFIQPLDQINGSLANFEMNRLVDAFWSNEQNINDYFKIKDIDNLALGTLEGVEYNYNSTTVVYADDFTMLVTQQRPLYDKSTGKEIANVILSLKCLNKPVFEDIDPSANIGKSLVQIEVIPNKLFASSFIFNTQSVSTTKNDDELDSDNDNDDGYINVKGKTTIL